MSSSVEPVPIELVELPSSANAATLENNANDEDTVDAAYPTGPKVWVAMGALYAAFFLNGLDLTIVAVAVPSVTNTFHTVVDIGWYSAAYGLVASGFKFLFGKSCTLYRPKNIVLLGLVFFVFGSLICTVAPTSKGFIMGRAFCGFGCSAVSSAAIQLIIHMFPSHKRSVWLSLVGSSQFVGLACAPVIGGALIDRFNWRACFAINLALCPLLIIFIVFFLEDPVDRPEYSLSVKEKLYRLDLPGTALVMPSVSCLLLALQWGGIKYGWHDVRIITLFMVFAVLFIAFGYWQYRRGELATVPPRILKQKLVLASTWFSVCTNGILAVVEYYVSIYWQGVRGESASKAGLLSVSMIVGLCGGSTLAGWGTNKIGYFTPFMLATTVLASIACGLLTTLDLDSAKAEVVALLGFIGFAVGVGVMGPIQAISTVLPAKDVAIGTAITGFGGGMGSALFITISATLFQTRLVDEITKYSPSTNVTLISDAGLSEISNLIGKANLKNVLTGYDHAVMQTLYLPVALSVLTLIGSASVGWPSVKAKRN